MREGCIWRRVRVKACRPATASPEPRQNHELTRRGPEFAAATVLWSLAFTLLLAPPSAAAAEQAGPAKPTPCPADALKEPMKNLARALGDKPSENSSCDAQLDGFVSIANKANARLSSTPSSTATRAWRLALASIVLSALALMSAPIITLMLFRRYGLVSWRLHVGD